MCIFFQVCILTRFNFLTKEPKKYMIEGKEYLLRVVFEDKKEQNVVLTAYLTSQVNRYWKEGKDEN